MPKTARQLADDMFAHRKPGANHTMLTRKQRAYLSNLIQREIDSVEREQKDRNPHRQACACVGDRAWQLNGTLFLRTETGEYGLGRLPNGVGCLGHEDY